MSVIPRVREPGGDIEYAIRIVFTSNTESSRSFLLLPVMMEKLIEALSTAVVYFQNWEKLQRFIAFTFNYQKIQKTTIP